MNYNRRRKKRDLGGEVWRFFIYGLAFMMLMQLFGADINAAYQEVGHKFDQSINTDSWIDDATGFVTQVTTGVISTTSIQDINQNTKDFIGEQVRVKAVIPMTGNYVVDIEGHKLYIKCYSYYSKSIQNRKEYIFTGTIQKNNQVGHYLQCTEKPKYTGRNFQITKFN